MSPVNSAVTGPNFTKFRTIYTHHMRCYCTQLDHDIAIRFLALVHRMQVVSVDVDNII